MDLDDLNNNLDPIVETDVHKQLRYLFDLFQNDQEKKDIIDKKYKVHDNLLRQIFDQWKEIDPNSNKIESYQIDQNQIEQYEIKWHELDDHD